MAGMRQERPAARAMQQPDRVHRRQPQHAGVRLGGGRRVERCLFGVPRRVVERRDRADPPEVGGDALHRDLAPLAKRAQGREQLGMGRIEPVAEHMQLLAVMERGQFDSADAPHAVAVQDAREVRDSVQGVVVGQGGQDHLGLDEAAGDQFGRQGAIAARGVNVQIDEDALCGNRGHAGFYPIGYQTRHRKSPCGGADSTRAVRVRDAITSSTAPGFSLPVPTAIRKPAMLRTIL